MKEVTGTVMQVGEHHAVAVYRREGLVWVAEFHGNHAELSDAASWFRAHLGTLRNCHLRRGAALETTTALTPELIGKIEELHRQADLDRTKAGEPLAALLEAIGRSSGAWLSRARAVIARRTRDGAENRIV